MEKIECVELFACTDKFDWLCDHSTDRKRSTTSGITVEFGEHNAVKIETVIEFLCRIDCVLTCHGVHHEKSLLRFDSFLDGRDFLHHLFVDSKTACGIDDYKVIMVGLGMADCIFSNLDRVLVAVFGVNRDIDLFGKNFQLVDSSRTIYVASYE